MVCGGARVLLASASMRMNSTCGIGYNRSIRNCTDSSGVSFASDDDGAGAGSAAAGGDAIAGVPITTLYEWRNDTE